MTRTMTGPTEISGPIAIVTVVIMKWKFLHLGQPRQKLACDHSSIIVHLQHNWKIMCFTLHLLFLLSNYLLSGYELFVWFLKCKDCDCWTIKWCMYSFKVCIVFRWKNSKFIQDTKENKNCTTTLIFCLNSSYGTHIHFISMWRVNMICMIMSPDS